MPKTSLNDHGMVFWEEKRARGEERTQKSKKKWSILKSCSHLIIVSRLVSEVEINDPYLQERPSVLSLYPNSWSLVIPECTVLLCEQSLWYLRQVSVPFWTRYSCPYCGHFPADKFFSSQFFKCTGDRWVTFRMFLEHALCVKPYNLSKNASDTNFVFVCTLNFSLPALDHSLMFATHYKSSWFTNFLSDW